MKKGTETLIRLWSQRTEWPVLTVIQHPENQLAVQADNINYIKEYLDDAALRRLQNESGVVLAPSEAEGFGHSIVEPMTTGAVVITTDAPPMNELVRPSRGILADYKGVLPHYQGYRYFVDPHSLEEAIQQALRMSAAEKEAMGRRARQWYEENDRFFRHAVVEEAQQLQEKQMTGR